MRRFVATSLCVVVAGSVLGGCANLTADTGDDPVVLEMLHIDGGPTLDPATAWFAKRVETLSDGEMLISTRHSCCGTGVDVEERLVAAVADGTAELGWVGTRVFDSLGVASLRAYTAPMLIDSYALEQAVIESEFASESLRVLDQLNIDGLALMPGSLRKPLSWHKPLLDEADWPGTTVVAFRSRLNEMSFKAVGSTPLQLGFEERDQGLLDRSIQATENSLIFQDEGREWLLRFAAVNVTLWPRISVLIANPAALERLTFSQAAVLMQAASDVAQKTPKLAAMDAEALESGCRAGARYAEASAAQLDALRMAFEPVYEVLEHDADTTRLVAEIRRLKKPVDAAGQALVIPPECLAGIG